MTARPGAMFYHVSLVLLFLMSTSRAASVSPKESAQVEFSTWPRGSYGFLMHKDGCAHESFEGSIRILDTENVDTFNLWPLDDGLEGTSNEGQLSFHFCSKMNPAGTYSWPTGTYCIHQVGGECPKGFENGRILFDEENSGPDSSVEEITLVDGNFEADTTFFYCCRHDRSPDHVIQIPNTRPFYLYPHQGQTCQKVFGMTSQLQRVLVDTEDNNNGDIIDGSHPESSKNKVGILFYICMYTPSTSEKEDNESTETVEKAENKTEGRVELGSEKQEEEMQIRTDWPRGSYGLPMAGSSCPDFYNFTRSYLYQDTEDEDNKNMWPKDVAMIGPMKSEGYRLHYCSKFDTEGSYDWPAGDYCIHRVGGECPNGFKEGSVRFDDENTQNANDRKGQLPDGVFDADTLLFFCCRNDGNSSHAIKLPNTKAFYLYRHTGACQAVVNMTVKVQIIKWDDENTNNADRSIGHTPESFMDDIGISLYFCWYKPKESLKSSNSWPRGRFSLPMTANEGCPEFFDFSKGYFFHSVPTDGAATTVYGKDSNRYGTAEKGQFEGGFCTKNSQAGTYDWPSGKYCLHRVNGECPVGFQNGTIYFGNDDLENKYSGFLPDGEYARGMKFQFCCRKDGSLSTAIKLPNTKPFILWLPHMNILHDYDCQQVEGMRVSATVVQIAVKPDGDSKVTGFSPGNDSKVAIYLVYCHYLPENENIY